MKRFLLTLALALCGASAHAQFADVQVLTTGGVTGLRGHGAGVFQLYGSGAPTLSTFSNEPIPLGSIYIDTAAGLEYYRSASTWVSQYATAGTFSAAQTFSAAVTFTAAPTFSQAYIDGLTKTLTESSATAVVQIPIAAGAGVGGIFRYCVFAADATDQQIRCGRVKFGVTNKAATETCGLTTDTATAADASITELEDGNAPSISASTLTYAITCDTTPSNAANIAINAVSGLTQTTLQVRYGVELIGTGSITPQ